MKGVMADQGEAGDRWMVGQVGGGRVCSFSLSNCDSSQENTEICCSIHVYHYEYLAPERDFGKNIYFNGLYFKQSRAMAMYFLTLCIYIYIFRLNAFHTHVHLEEAG